MGLHTLEHKPRAITADHVYKPLGAMISHILLWMLAWAGVVSSSGGVTVSFEIDTPLGPAIFAARQVRAHVSAERRLGMSQSGAGGGAHELIVCVCARQGVSFSASARSFCAELAGVRVGNCVTVLVEEAVRIHSLTGTLRTSSSRRAHRRRRRSSSSRRRSSSNRRHLLTY